MQATISKFDYAYDADGQITNWTQQAGAETPKVWIIESVRDASKLAIGVVTEAVCLACGVDCDQGSMLRVVREACQQFIGGPDLLTFNFNLPRLKNPLNNGYYGGSEQ